MVITSNVSRSCEVSSRVGHVIPPCSHATPPHHSLSSLVRSVCNALYIFSLSFCLYHLNNLILLHTLNTQNMDEFIFIEQLTLSYICTSSAVFNNEWFVLTTCLPSSLASLTTGDNNNNQVYN